MSQRELLETLSAQGIELWVEGGRLRFRAPKGALTPALRATLTENKEALVTLLREQASQSITELPMAYGQQSLWFLHQVAPDTAAYNVSFSARIRSEVNIEALQASFQALLDRHAILRTTYTARDGQPVQQIYGYLPVNFEQIEAAGWSEETLYERVRRDYLRPFDLQNGPILRVSLYTRAPEDHVLLITVHHIAVDGWSLWLLLDDLRLMYTAQVEGTAASLPRPEAEYSDYLRWQTDLLKNAEGERLWTYWKNQLSGELPVLNLPADFPRPHTQAYRGASHNFLIDEKLTTQLKNVAKAEGVTLYMILLSAFEVLLHRYSAQEEILVGSPTFGRSRPEFSKIVGDFVNMTTLRADFSSNPKFNEFLSQVRQTVLGALDHQDYPFARLIEQLGGQRDPSRSPLFQATFDLQRIQAFGELGALFLPGENHSRVEFGKLILEPYATPQQEGQFDLALQMAEVEDTLPAVIKYNNDLFEAATIQRMEGHYRTLLESIVADPSTCVVDLTILTPAERSQIVVEWNDTRVDYPQNVWIHQLFEGQAAKTPDAPAVIFEGQTLTYAELNQRANQLAHYLQGRGVVPDTLVGVCMERSLEMVISLYAVLKAGGAYVPMDPDYPADRLSHMLSDSGVAVLLTQEKIADNLPEHSAQIIRVDSEWATIAQQSAENPNVALTGDNLAYMIYTSGSTGKPKGAMNTHKGIYNRLMWMQDAYQLTADDAAMQKTPFSFDVSVWEFFWPLMFGARLVVAQPGGHRDPAYLIRLINEQKITTLHFVPSMLAQFVNERDVESCISLRRVICSGEALPLDLQTRFFARLKSELHNLYGPTEAAIDVTYWACDPKTTLRTVPIGRAIANTQIYLLDPQLQPVPIGIPGELHIGGVNLARGYHNRPELTAEKFIANPFETGMKLYKTGDLARFLPDGNIEYLGRIDHQVKIRGFRIELGEIEATLNQHPSVRESAVIVREDIPGDKRIVAYVVPLTLNPSPTRGEGLENQQLAGPDPTNVAATTSPSPQQWERGAGGEGQNPNAANLRQFLQESLPEYMIPSAFVTLEALPLSPNGKLERRALPLPDQSQMISTARYVAPRTPLEELVAGSWSSVLRVEQVGINDNFFELGGHSLLATQVISQIREAAQVDLPLRAIFEAPTVAGLAELIESMRRKGAKLQLPPIQTGSHNGHTALSFAQERMWVLHQMATDRAAYNISGAIRMKGALDPVALVKSLREIFRRYEAFRTGFTERSDETIQVIQPEVDFMLPQVDLRSVPDQEAEMKRLFFEMARKPFYLDQPPLFRGSLLQLADDDFIFLLSMHHLISDGWSLGLFSRELSAFYTAFSGGSDSIAPAPTLQYADFAVWQRQYFSEEALEPQLNYWKEKLAGKLPILKLPADYPRTSMPAFTGSYIPFSLPPELAMSIKALARQEKATMFMLLLSAFQTLLYRYTDEDDIIVGSVIANRNRAEVENMLGVFINPIAFRSDFSGSPSFRKLLKQVRDSALGAYENQDLPFDNVMRVIQLERDPSHMPVFQTMFIYQEDPIQALKLGDLTVERMELYNSTTLGYDVTLQMWDAGHTLSGILEYRTDLFKEETISRMLGHFFTLLESIAANPDEAVSALPMLTTPERQQLLIAWNNTNADFPVDRCYQELFEAQVAKTPERTAVIFENERFTYDQLNKRTNRLARVLVEQKVGKDVVVALLDNRGSNLLMSMIGTFKAGGAYLPLDPEHPPQRLAQVLGQSETPLVLVATKFEAAINEALELLPADKRPTVLNLEKALQEQRPDDNLPLRCGPDDLAYVIYTSGSTGLPKGAMVEQKGMINHMYAKIADLNLVDTDKIAQTASQCFDISVWQFFIAMVIGAEVHIYNDDVTHDPSQIMNVVARDQITILELVPSMIRAMMLEVEMRGAEQYDLSSLTWLIPTGEALPPELCRQWFAYYPNIPLLNAYGPTECSDDITHYPVYEPPGEHVINMPVGRPVANMRMYVLDRHMQPVPIGVAGQLCVGGIGVGRGYLLDPKRTADAFVSDPFTPGGRMYKTGDLGRYWPDGNIEYQGRMDFQVKIRGFRIELGEIEAALDQHPNVRQSVVVAREDKPGDKMLAAYYVSEGQPVPTPNELRDYLRDRLPPYMIPPAIVMLDALPLTPNGKINRRGLPAPEPVKRELPQMTQAMTPTEEIINRVWQEILGMDQISVYDNFFDLGGHSLQAVQVITRLEKETGVRGHPAMLRFATLGQLAAQYDEQDIPADAEKTAAEAPKQDAVGGFGRKLFQALKRAVSSDQK